MQKVMKILVQMHKRKQQETDEVDYKDGPIGSWRENT